MEFPRKHTTVAEGYAKNVLLILCVTVIGWLKNSLELSFTIMQLQVCNRYNQNIPVQHSISFNHYNSDIIYKINDVAYHGRVE